jgi:hypothetical protein
VSADTGQLLTSTFCTLTSSLALGPTRICVVPFLCLLLVEKCCSSGFSTVAGISLGLIGKWQAFALFSLQGFQEKSGSVDAIK